MRGRPGGCVAAMARLADTCRKPPAR